MKYLCLVHMEPGVVAGMGPAERHDLDVRSMGHDDALAASGHLIVAQALQGAETAVLVKVRDGRMSTTGPGGGTLMDVMVGLPMLATRVESATARVEQASSPWISRRVGPSSCPTSRGTWPPTEPVRNNRSHLRNSP